MRLNELYRPARQSDVTCLSFGRDRKTLYPAYFFCHGCDLLEDAVLNQNKRANRKQKLHQCTGGHDNFSHPTTLLPEYRPNRRNKEFSSTIDKEEAHGQKRCSSTTTAGGSTPGRDCKFSRNAADTFVSSSPTTKSPTKKKIRPGVSPLAFVYGNDESSSVCGEIFERSVLSTSTGKYRSGSNSRFLKTLTFRN